MLSNLMNACIYMGDLIQYRLALIQEQADRVGEVDDLSDR